MTLHALKRSGLLEFPLDLVAGIVGVGLAVEGKEGTEVELRLLEELDLANVDLLWSCMLAYIEA